MKIGILTFHAAFNYGSMLQAYAMKTWLHNHGFFVEIINYQPKRQKKLYAKPFGSISLKRIAIDINRIRKYGFEYIGMKHRWDKFHSFLCDELQVGNEINNIADFETYCNKYDIIIYGSDQIWNIAAYDFDPVYIGKAAPSSVKLVAYAPSLGPSPESLDMKMLRTSLKRFSAVSVREQRSMDFLIGNDLFPDVKTVLDPTMLLTGIDYSEISSQDYNDYGDYIYYYTPGNRPEFMDIAIKISKQSGDKLLVDTGYILSRNNDSDDSVITVKDAGPKEFLSLVKNAKMVIGASFHLIVFAILFHKPFYCINGDVDSRMNHLLMSLGLNDRIISLDRNSSSIMIDELIDWDAVERHIVAIKNQSEIFLLNNLI